MLSFLLNVFFGARGYSWRAPLIVAAVETPIALALVYAKLLSAGVPYRLNWAEVAGTAYLWCLLFGTIGWGLGRLIARWRISRVHSVAR